MVVGVHVSRVKRHRSEACGHIDGADDSPPDDGVLYHRLPEAIY